MAELTPLVEAWIRYADDDWQDSQILATAGRNGRSICFHVQQCINLRELSDLLHQADDAWSAETMTLNRLSLAAVDFRYPDPSEPEPEIDLVIILQIAAELRARLLDRLGAHR